MDRVGPSGETIIDYSIYDAINAGFTKVVFIVREYFHDQIEKAFKENYAFHLRLGYNWIRHQDFGEHEDERGDGYGFTLGYKRYFKEGHKGFFIGARNDFWFNDFGSVA